MSKEIITNIFEHTAVQRKKNEYDQEQVYVYIKNLKAAQVIAIKYPQFTIKNGKCEINMDIYQATMERIC